MTATNNIPALRWREAEPVKSLLPIASQRSQLSRSAPFRKETRCGRSWSFRLVRADYDQYRMCQEFLSQGVGLGHASCVDAKYTLLPFYSWRKLGKWPHEPAGWRGQNRREAALDWVCRGGGRGRYRCPH